MESPTTASAAATTIMKKMKTTPVIESILLANVTNDRLTALSISSMLIKITMTFLRSITPRTPIVNRMTLSNKMYSIGIINIFNEISFLQSQQRQLRQLVKELQ